MSAITYSGLRNYGKTSLPSVESWSQNMNILKDPPKSIHTRRIDKTGTTSSRTVMIDESGDRASGCINVYARGVNPMVSVSYNNNGNNGGQRSGSNITPGGNSQTSLPYKIMNYGAFRPPVLTPTDLYPLSRLPRVWTTSFTNPSFPDFSKKMRTCGTAETTKEVKNVLLKTCARPTAVYKMETPISENYEVKHVIQPTLKKSYNTAKSSTDRTTQNVSEPNKGINYNNIHPFANSNKQDSRVYVNNNEFNGDRYLQDTNAHSVFTNISDINYVNDINEFNGDRYLQETNAHPVYTNISDINYTNDINEFNGDRYLQETNAHPVYTNISDINYTNDINEFNGDRYLQDTNAHPVYTNMGAHIQLSSLEDILDLSNVKTQNTINIDYTTPLSGNEKVTYLNTDIELERSIPSHNAFTNLQKNERRTLQHEYMKELDRNVPLTHVTSNAGKYGENNISSRDYQLAERTFRGGFEGKGQLPMLDRMQNVEQYESEKSVMNKKVNSLFDRYRVGTN